MRCTDPPLLIRFLFVPFSILYNASFYCFVFAFLVLALSSNGWYYPNSAYAPITVLDWYSVASLYFFYFFLSPLIGRCSLRRKYPLVLYLIFIRCTFLLFYFRVSGVGSLFEEVKIHYYSVYIFSALDWYLVPYSFLDRF